MRKLAPALIIVALAFTGCIGPKSVMSPNGKQGFVVECNGSYGSWAECYDIAANACKGQYNVLDRNEGSMESSLGRMVTRNMTIECK